MQSNNPKISSESNEERGGGGRNLTTRRRTLKPTDGLLQRLKPWSCVLGPLPHGAQCPTPVARGAKGIAPVKEPAASASYCCRTSCPPPRTHRHRLQSLRRLLTRRRRRHRRTERVTGERGENGPSSQSRECFDHARALTAVNPLAVWPRPRGTWRVGQPCQKSG